MYEFEHYRQLGLADFNQPLGLKMNLENRCVKRAVTINRKIRKQRMLLLEKFMVHRMRRRQQEQGEPVISY